MSNDFTNKLKERFLENLNIINNDILNVDIPHYLKLICIQEDVYNEILPIHG